MGHLKKSLFALLCTISFVSSSQEVPEDWYMRNPETDTLVGIALNEAHELLKDRKSNKVIVAVIDSGLDIGHEDLQGKIWTNEGEVPENGIDDDKNGYIDDINGWNFIGGSEGAQVEFDTYELTRQYVALKSQYEFQTVAPEGKEDEYEFWKTIQKEFKDAYSQAMREFIFYRDIRNSTADYMDVVKQHLKVDSLHSDMVRSLETKDPLILRAKNALENIANLVGGDAEFESLLDELNGATEHFEVQMKYGYNENYNPREIIQDNWSDEWEVGYGNNLVYGPHAEHGTHVSGTIASIRGNGLGIDGILDNVVIMPLRTVPNGDERDKDVAAAIMYAVDNGAQVINMSFGKYFKNRKHVVDSALRYAESRDVLLVTGAGNDSKDIDENINYPSRILDSGDIVKNWITVGATEWSADEGFLADFSNYGKESVDIFAPGVSIYSTYPESKYEWNQGTSMASPIVAGVAALVRSYFPGLSAVQVKEILLETTTTFDNLNVKYPAGEKTGKMEELSVSGGVVNAKKAVERAREMTR